jgi:hypothetical protein
MKMEQGQIWQVQSDGCLVKEWGVGLKKPRQVMLEVGEYIEIRFPYAWHFRTIEDRYFEASEEMLWGHCKYIGIILPDVQFKNKAKLKEIIELELFTTTPIRGE